MTEYEKRRIEGVIISFISSGMARNMTPSDIGRLFQVSDDSKMMRMITSLTVKYVQRGFAHRG